MELDCNIASSAFYNLETIVGADILEIRYGRLCRTGKYGTAQLTALASPCSFCADAATESSEMSKTLYPKTQRSETPKMRDVTTEGDAEDEGVDDDEGADD